MWWRRWSVMGLLTAGILGMAGGGFSAEFYVDPVNGSMVGDGSQARPWRTVQEVIEQGLIESRAPVFFPYSDLEQPLEPLNPGAPVQPGDTLYLLSGYHGEIVLSGMFNAAPITIAAAPGHTPNLSRVWVSGGSRWHFRGLHVSPAFSPSFDNWLPQSLIFLQSHGWRGPVAYITVEGCSVYSVWDASAWSERDWDGTDPVARVSNGIYAYGDHLVIRDNLLKNVNFGITGSGRNILVERNTIDHFSGDGMRFIGTDAVYQYNTVKHLLKVNANHSDGFQSWNTEEFPVIRRVVLRGNAIINQPVPDQLGAHALQAIGCFDGPYDDWLIENNLLLSNHAHAITVTGGTNIRAINNTAYDVTNEWYGAIRFVANRDGIPPRRSVIRNNIAEMVSDPSEEIAVDHNVIVSGRLNRAGSVSPHDVFADFENGDFRLRPGSPALDSGSAESAPPFDHAGAVRPLGSGVDIGAFEYGAASDPPFPPSAFFTTDRLSGDPPLTVRFDASGSRSVGGSIVFYGWDFDEDGREDATGRTAERTFNTMGVHKVILTVRDGRGLESLHQVGLNVGSVSDDENSDGGDPPRDRESATNDILTLSKTVIRPGAMEPVRITCRLPNAGDVRLKIVDTRGEDVRVLHVGQLGAGAQAFSWDGKNDLNERVASGIYHLQFTFGDEMATQKIAVMR